MKRTYTTVYKLTRQNMFGLVHNQFRNGTGLEEGKKKVRILFIYFFLDELGGNKCFINHCMLSDETFWLCHRILRVGRTVFGTSGSRMLMNGNSGLAYFNVGNTGWKGGGIRENVIV